MKERKGKKERKSEKKRERALLCNNIMHVCHVLQKKKKYIQKYARTHAFVIFSEKNVRCW